jgi:hypothetical protein
MDHDARPQIITYMLESQQRFVLVSTRSQLFTKLLYDDTIRARQLPIAMPSFQWMNLLGHLNVAGSQINFQQFHDGSDLQDGPFILKPTKSKERPMSRCYRALNYIGSLHGKERNSLFSI